MANWLSNAIGDVNKLTSKIPGIGVAEKGVNFLSDVVGQGVTDVLGSGGINPYGNQYKSIFDLGGGGGGKAQAQTPDVIAPPIPTSSTAAGGGQTGPNDALTMGLGMFFKQYLAPLLQQQSQTNNALIGQYGTAMNQALSHQLPPGIKEIMSASVPQQQGLMEMMNQAGVQQAAGAGPYEQFIQGVGGQSSAMQALADAFTKMATASSIYGGQAGPLSSALTQALGGPNTLGGLLAGVVGGAGGGAGGLSPLGVGGLGLPGVGGVPQQSAATQAAPTAAATSGQTQSGSPVTASTITQLNALTPSEQAQYWQSLTSEQQAAFQQLGYAPPGSAK